MCRPKEKKDYSRSVRMTATVQKYIENQSGDGFNQKFENMVLYCMKKESELKKTIAEKEKRLNDLNQRISKSQTILQDIDRMKYQIESVIRTANTLVNANDI